MELDRPVTDQARPVTSDQGVALAAQAEALAIANMQLQRALSQSQQARQELERTQRAMLNMMEDLAETKRHLEHSNHELTTLDGLKDEFISILSHELRTPVNAITGFGSVLADGLAGELTPLQLDYMNKILGGADRLLMLVNDLLDYSRIRAGKFVLDRTVMDLGEVLEESVELMRELIERKGLRLRCVPHVRPVAVLGDRQRLGQAVVNLLGNAIKFTPADGEVCIGVQPRGAFGYVEVQDTGIGISAADVPRLFKQFGLLDTSNTRAGHGTGLGLVIVKALVEAHGGHVGVESEPSRGSTFWFTVPLAHEEHDVA